MPTLYLMMGYPGSGKTTTSHVIHELTGAVHLWADQMRCERFGTPTYSKQETKELYEHLNQVTDELLATGQSVIYDTNFNFYRDRQIMRQIAAKHKADVKLIWVRAPRELAHARATQNAHKQGTRILGNMPDEVFEHLAGGLQEPRAEEEVTILDGTKISAEYVRQKLEL
jgi:predicted kinase